MRDSKSHASPLHNRTYFASYNNFRTNTKYAPRTMKVEIWEKKSSNLSRKKLKFTLLFSIGYQIRLNTETAAYTHTQAQELGYTYTRERIVRIFVYKVFELSDIYSLSKHWIRKKKRSYSWLGESDFKFAWHLKYSVLFSQWKNWGKGGYKFNRARCVKMLIESSQLI